jgi:hypothetical protein
MSSTDLLTPPVADTSSIEPTDVIVSSIDGVIYFITFKAAFELVLLSYE